MAAFLVVIEHLRSLMFADFGTNVRREVLERTFYFFTGFGHSAVMVFFVMSGFLVGGKVLDRLARGNFDWKKYCTDRVSRLYVVYIVALLVGAGLDYFGSHYFNRFGLYDQTFPGKIAIINHNFQQNLSVPIFMVNLAMCQTILGPVFGSNGPLWSLANEFWYYLAGPLFFALIFHKQTLFRVFGTIGFIFIVWFLPAPILMYGVVWLLGAALYFVNHRALAPLWITFPLFAVSFCIARLQWLMTPYFADFLIGISFALVINSATANSRRIPGNAWSKTAAGFSYSVYLCHFPLLIFVASVLFQINLLGLRQQPTLKLGISYILILILTYAWCFLISLATERRTPQARAWINRVIAHS